MRLGQICAKISQNTVIHNCTEPYGLTRYWMNKTFLNGRILHGRAKHVPRIVAPKLFVAIVCNVIDVHPFPLTRTQATRVHFTAGE